MQPALHYEMERNRADTSLCGIGGRARAVVRMVPILLAACFCSAARADFSYQIRIQVNAGGVTAKSATTNLIKGNRMALVRKDRTTVIDLAAETITEIDAAKKTYSVIPFADMRRALEDAAAKDPRETGFKVTIRKPSQTKLIGILTASEMVLSMEGPGGETIAVDSWIGTVPGYTQMIDFNRRLEEKMGVAYASGMALLVLGSPRALQGLGEAAKELNKAPGAPLQTSIKITAPEGSVADASIQMDNFGGGLQDATRFDPPAGSKKVDGVLPALPK
jgi:hypothetical protein